MEKSVLSKICVMNTLPVTPVEKVNYNLYDFNSCLGSTTKEFNKNEK